MPFLLAAAALPRMKPALDALRRHHRAVQVVSGVFIMAMGVLIYLDAFTRMASLFTFSSSRRRTAHASGAVAGAGDRNRVMATTR